MRMIEATDLSKKYGQRRALDGLSFGVEEGDIFVQLPHLAVLTAFVAIAARRVSLEGGGRLLFVLEALLYCNVLCTRQTIQEATRRSCGNVPLRARAKDCG
jgi:hypothetical protein